MARRAALHAGLVSPYPRRVHPWKAYKHPAEDRASRARPCSAWGRATNALAPSSCPRALVERG
eukprot:2747229-Pyramimonas_sp.AAC.1